MSRFVLVYQADHVPSKEETSAVLRALAALKVVDHMPGIILLEGDYADVAAVLRTNKKWSCAPASARAAASCVKDS